MVKKPIILHRRVVMWFLLFVKLTLFISGGFIWDTLLKPSHVNSFGLTELYITSLLFGRGVKIFCCSVISIYLNWIVCLPFCVWVFKNHFLIYLAAALITAIKAPWSSSAQHNVALPGQRPCDVISLCCWIFGAMKGCRERLGPAHQEVL